MNRCQYPKIGEMLHAYELNQLDPENREKFEIHLLECEHCFNEVANFEKIAEVMTQDPEIRDVVAMEIGVETGKSESSLWTRIWRLLWPQTSFVLKPAVVYLVIILMAYPAYRGIHKATDNNIRQVVPLNLVPNRSSSAEVIQSGNDILLTFVFNGALPEKFYDVEIKTSTGEVIYRNERFKGFDKYEVGRLIIPESKIGKGEYTLTIHDRNQDSSNPEQSYSFSIK